MDLQQKMLQAFQDNQTQTITVTPQSQVSAPATTPPEPITSPIYRMPDLPHYGLSNNYALGMSAPSTADQLTHMHQQTASLNAVNHNIAAKSTFNANAQKAWREQELANSAYWLQQQHLRPLNLGPTITFPLDWGVLPANLVKLAAAISRSLGQDCTAVLYALIGAIAIAMRGRYRVKLNDDWFEPVIIWFFLFSQSGTRKSKLKDLLSKPMLKVFEKLQEVFISHSQHTYRKNIMKKKALRLINDTIIKNALKAHMLSRGGHDSHNVLAEIERNVDQDALNLVDLNFEEPPLPQLFIGNCTPHKLVDFLCGQGESLAIFEDEAGLIQRFMKNTPLYVELLLKSKNMEPYWGGGFSLRNPALNKLYLIQPEIAADFYLNDKLNDMGLTARFLPYFAARSNLPLNDIDTIFDESLNLYERKIETMLNRNFDQNPQRKIFTIEVQPEAVTLIKNFQAEINMWQQSDQQSYLSAFLNKLAGEACRLAGALHAWDNEAPEASTLSFETMRAGISLAKTLIPHADYAFNPNGLGAFKGAKKLLHFIQERRLNSFNPRNLRNNLSLFKRVPIDPSLNLLAEHNNIAILRNHRFGDICLVHPNLSMR